jgi:hypothetical protein
MDRLFSKKTIFDHIDDLGLQVSRQPVDADRMDALIFGDTSVMRFTGRAQPLDWGDDSPDGGL